MIISKRLEDAEFIMSKDELTYSAVIEDFKNNLTKYQVFHKLSPLTLKYFNLLKDETYLDDFGNVFKCISHTIEY